MIKEVYDLSQTFQHLLTHPVCTNNNNEEETKKEALINSTSNRNSIFDELLLKDLKLLKLLGSGTFGEVYSVQNRKVEKQKFALKRIKKSFIIDQGLTPQIYNEKDIQYACDSIFIVKLHKTFQDKGFLYFLLEYCANGDLFTLSRRQRSKCFKSPKARFIAACVLEALNYLHTLDYAFLDLKPENILIDYKGIVKLTDFGNAVHLPDKKKSFLYGGTCEYMAPEIYLTSGHDKTADYWAYGVLIYELLVGKTPFVASTEEKSKKLVLRGLKNSMLPKTLSENASSLIKSLICIDASKRLLAHEIIVHPWFNTFNWIKLRAGKLKSPFAYKPKIK